MCCPHSHGPVGSALTTAGTDIHSSRGRCRQEEHEQGAGSSRPRSGKRWRCGLSPGAGCGLTHRSRDRSVHAWKYMVDGDRTGPALTQKEDEEAQGEAQNRGSPEGQAAYKIRRRPFWTEPAKADKPAKKWLASGRVYPGRLLRIKTAGIKRRSRFRCTSQSPEPGYVFAAPRICEFARPAAITSGLSHAVVVVQRAAQPASGRG